MKVYHAMKNKNLRFRQYVYKVTFYLTGGILGSLLSLCLFAGVVSASTLASQSLDTGVVCDGSATNCPQISGSLGFFNMGTGLSGTASYLYVDMSNVNHSYEAGLIYECADVNCQSVLNTYTSVASTSVSDGLARYQFSPAITLNSAHYYSFLVSASSYEKFNGDTSGSVACMVTRIWSNYGGSWNYWLRLQTNCSGMPFYALTDSGGYVPSVTNTTTHIDTVIPNDGAVVATSSLVTIGVTGYVNEPTAWYDSLDVVVQIAHSTNGSNVYAVNGTNPQIISYITFKYPTGSSGAFSFSTTTSAVNVIGEYTLTSSIEHTVGLGNYLGFYTYTDVSTTTAFLYGQHSVLDEHASSTNAYFERISAGVDDCSWSALFSTSTSTLACLKDLIVPTSQQWHEIITSQDVVGFVKKPPFGYVSQMYSVFFDEATSSLPTMSYTFGSSSPAVLWGVNVTFDPFSHMDTLNTVYTDNGDHKNLWDIVDPYFTMIVSISVFLVILSDLMKIEIMHDATQVSEEDYLEVRSGYGLPTGSVMETTRHTSKVFRAGRVSRVVNTNKRLVNKSKRRF